MADRLRHGLESRATVNGPAAKVNVCRPCVVARFRNQLLPRTQVEMLENMLRLH